MIKHFFTLFYIDRVFSFIRYEIWLFIHRYCEKIPYLFRQTRWIVNSIIINEIKWKIPSASECCRDCYYPDCISWGFILFYDPHFRIDVVGFGSKLTFQRSIVIFAHSTLYFHFDKLSCEYSGPDNIRRWFPAYLTLHHQMQKTS